MAGKVDELFGDGSAPAQPRLVRVWVLLLSGLVLCILGLACLSVPGAVLVLLATMYVDVERERVDNGFLPESDRDRVLRARSACYLGVVFCALVVLIQWWLYCSGVYTALGDLFLSGPPPEWIQALLG